MLLEPTELTTISNLLGIKVSDGEEGEISSIIIESSILFFSLSSSSFLIIRKDDSKWTMWLSNPLTYDVEYLFLRRSSFILMQSVPDLTQLEHGFSKSHFRLLCRQFWHLLRIKAERLVEMH